MLEDLAEAPGPSAGMWGAPPPDPCYKGTPEDYDAFDGINEIGEVDAEMFHNFAFLLQLVMLAIAFIIGLLLKHYKFHYLHEAGATLLIGVIVGNILWVRPTSYKHDLP